MITRVADGFDVRQSRLDLGAVRVWEAAGLPHGTRRMPSPIGSPDPAMFCLLVTLRGALRAGGTICAAGELYPCDTSRPLELGFCPPDGPYHLLGVEVPRTMLSVPPGAVDGLVGVPIPARDGVGLLLTTLLTRLTGDHGSYRPADGPRLGSVLLDLVSAVVAHALDGESLAPHETGRQAMSNRIHAFIQEHLQDPCLSPQTVADAHHISTRYLHRLFQTHDTTVARWIRRQRLERARRDLTDPSLLSIPIHRIAARWGFPHAADFTRAFRTAYGLTPTDYRHQYN